MRQGTQYRFADWPIGVVSSRIEGKYISASASASVLRQQSARLRPTLPYGLFLLSTCQFHTSHHINRYSGVVLHVKYSFSSVIELVFLCQGKRAVNDSEISHKP